MDPGFQKPIRLALLGLMLHVSQQHSSKANSTWESVAPWCQSAQEMDDAPSWDSAGSVAHMGAGSSWFLMVFEQAPPLAASPCPYLIHLGLLGF